MRHTIVYFLQRADGLIKIGTTNDLDRRKPDLEKAHGPLTCLKTINGDQAHERRIQTRLKAHNQFGEWFRSSSEVLSFIDSVDKGELVPLQANGLEEAWRIGELGEVSNARKLAERLVAVHRKRIKKSTNPPVLASLNRVYGFRAWFLRRLIVGSPETITAYAVTKLRAALKAELEFLIGELQDELTAEYEGMAQEAEEAALAAREKQRLIRRGRG